MSKKNDTRGERVVLSHAERKTSTGFLIDPEVSAREERRGRIIKMLADGWTQAEVCRSLRAGIATVGRVRRRYFVEGLDSAVLGYAAPLREKQIREAKEARIVALVRSDPPEDRARRTAELTVSQAIELKMINKIGRESVRFVSQATWRETVAKKTWRVPEIDEQHRERMGDVLELYEKPYNDKEPVICIGEKPTQFLKAYRKSEERPDGSVRDDYEYKHHGTSSIVCCVESNKGRRIVQAKT